LSFPAEYPSPSKVNSTTNTYIHSLFPSISTDSMRSFLGHFSGGFRTRYYKSSTGAESSKWLQSKVEEFAKLNKAAKVSVRSFEHPWGQNSIIARIPAAASAEGGKKDKKKSVVVVGAHQDSTNLWPFLPAPGGESSAIASCHLA
jgi:leucyl aminopeptidase